MKKILKNAKKIKMMLAVVIFGASLFGCSSFQNADSKNAAPSVANAKAGNTSKATSDENASPGVTIEAADLLKRYKSSKESVRNDYEGKQITVRGYALTSATLPKSDRIFGILGIMEKGETSAEIQCRFSLADSEKFSKIKGDQFVTVKGVFGVDLLPQIKPCTLVKVE